jgi:hypothetical protein
VSALLTVKIHYISKFIHLRNIIQDLVLHEQQKSQSSPFWSVDQDDCIITMFFIFNSMEQALAQDIHMIDFLNQIREMWEKIEMEFHKVIIDEISRQQIPIFPETQLVQQR